MRTLEYDKVEEQTKEHPIEIIVNCGFQLIHKRGHFWLLGSYAMNGHFKINSNNHKYYQNNLGAKPQKILRKLADLEKKYIKMSKPVYYMYS